MTAKWAIKNLPDEWSKIIRSALKFNETGCESDIRLKRIERFIEFAEAQLHAAELAGD